MRFPLVTRRYHEKQLSHWIHKYMAQCTRAADFQIENESLKAQLAQAQKNDMPQDPITGKFIKKKGE